MSDELQKEIDRLKSENAKLAESFEEAKAKLKDTSHEARDRRLESKTLEQQLEALRAEREAEKASTATEREAVKAELLKSQALIRGLKHEGAFARVAEDLKVKDPAKRADLYRLAEYKSDAFEPDVAKIKESFSAVLKDRPWLIDEDKAQAAAAAKSAAGAADGREWARSDLKPAPGSQRGQSTTTESKSTPRERIPGRL